MWLLDLATFSCMWVAAIDTVWVMCAFERFWAALFATAKIVLTMLRFIVFITTDVAVGGLEVA